MSDLVCPWCRSRSIVDEAAAVCRPCARELGATGYDLSGKGRPSDRDERRDGADPFYKGRVSASALGTFVRCPEQYRRTYLLGEWGPSNPSLLVGNTVHAALERYWRWQMQTGQPPDVDLADEICDAEYHVQEERDEIDWEDSTPGKTHENALSVFRAYVDRVAPLVVPRLVEQWFQFRVPGVEPDLVGKVDLVGDVVAPGSQISDAQELASAWDVAPGEPEPTLTRMLAKTDVKTSGKAAAKRVTPDWWIQGLVYLLVDDLPMTWHTATWRGKNGPVVRTPASRDVDPDALVLTRTPETYASALEVVRQLVRAIELYHATYGPDEPWPSGAVAHTWACQKCHLRDDAEAPCVYWHGRRVVHFEGVS